AATAAAKAAYPLKTCVVSDDKLEDNSMGGPVDYFYKVAGKPDRLVIFCCKDCVKDFEKEPAKYLAKIDAAAAAKTKSPLQDHCSRRGQTQGCSRPSALTLPSAAMRVFVRVLLLASMTAATALAA